jgi:hypothetical protein
MGCDIHIHIEIKREGNNYWEGFGGEFSINRNYMLFGIMAKGVRSSIDDGYEIRGIPPDLSSNVMERLYYSVGKAYWSEDRVVTEEIAACWAEHNYPIEDMGHYRRILNPDTHSHSWLTLSELKNVMEICRNVDKYFSELYNVRIESIVSAMETLEKMYLTRMVFWFDN